MSTRLTWSPIVLALSLALFATACGSASGSNADGTCTPSDSPTLTFLAYSTPQAVYDAKIIPAFKAQWKEEHDGQVVNFLESYGPSTTQAQNVVNGQGADVVALSLAPDVDTISDAGLITSDWTAQPDGGMVSASVVVLAVHKGNPRGIEDWNDLSTPGVGVLTPDPAQSGGARWNLVSLWGAALRGDVAGTVEGDEAGATTLMNGVTANVLAYDSSARSSIQNFESGNGDVAITYENEVKTAQAAGTEDEAVYPKGSILIENPVAIVDRNVDEHCVRDVAEAFAAYLHTDEAKAFYAEDGYLRSTDKAEAQAGDPAGGYPAIQDLFTVDELGGWDALNTQLFDPTSGIATQAVASTGQ